MDFAKLVEQVLYENNVAGGANSVHGPNVVNTATSVSGDNYAPNDSRVMTSLYSGVLTRFGKTGKKSNSKKKTSKRKRKQWI